MELIIAIATLCHITTGRSSFSNVDKYQLKCQQSYIHCVSVKNITLLNKELALQKCILEKNID